MMDGVAPFQCNGATPSIIPATSLCGKATARAQSCRARPERWRSEGASLAELNSSAPPLAQLPTHQLHPRPRLACPRLLTQIRTWAACRR